VALTAESLAEVLAALSALALLAMLEAGVTALQEQLALFEKALAKKNSALQNSIQVRK
jgi:hypothetical protein